jgi:two-component system, LytTR family, sensor kinase
MKLSLKILIHGIYWLVFSQFSIMVSMGRSLGEWPHLNNLTPHFIINFFWAATIFYLFYFYFIRFFERRQFTKYLLFSALSSIAITIMLMPLHKFFNPRFEFYNLRFMIPPIVGTFLIAQSGCLIRGFENWFTNIQLKTELETRNLKNELNLLKSQINPHFLFNSLNNIDSLIRTYPDNASTALIRLSEMLRYMIYETQSDKVLLNKEIVYIKNYILLQQLRYREKDYVKITFPIICEGIQIAPMILIPFIENAFKYAFNVGILPVIEINMICQSNSLFFSCRNYYKKGKPQYKSPHGIGLENVKRRLALLYPEKFHLAIFDKDQVFKIELSIQLG